MIGPVRAASAAIVVFLASAAVLVLEILAAREMAPYVGVSLNTYTGIIGTVLAGLGLLAVGAIFLIGALFVSSVDDCQATGDDTTFTVHC